LRGGDTSLLACHGTVHQAQPRDLVASGLVLYSGLECGAVGVGGGFLIITILLHRVHLPA
jgi:hypothetical protein